MEDQTIQIIKSNAIKAFKGASAESKLLLKDLFGDKVLYEDITEITKSYEDACAIKGISPMTIDQFCIFPENQREYLFCVHKDDIINQVLNEGWEADFSDDTYKYFPRFYWDENKAGGPGFSYFVCDYHGSDSSVDARRTYKNSKLAEYSGKQFIDIHNVIQSRR